MTITGNRQNADHGIKEKLCTICCLMFQFFTQKNFKTSSWLYITTKMINFHDFFVYFNFLYFLYIYIF